MTATSVPTEAPTMNATDRCDRCGAQAYVETKHGDMVLLWCVHHFKANEEALSASVTRNEIEQVPS